MKSYSVCRLIPPRPTYSADLKESEPAITRQRSRYWRSLLEQSEVLIVARKDQRTRT